MQSMTSDIERMGPVTLRVITHVLPLRDAAKGYQMSVDKADDCEKVVLKAA